MTKQEAIGQMKKGVKITHQTLFTNEEWITMQGNINILTEEGYSVSKEEFWKYRTGKAFESGWVVFKEN